LLLLPLLLLLLLLLSMMMPLPLLLQLLHCGACCAAPVPAQAVLTAGLTAATAQHPVLLLHQVL
jgi:hypothetical protein